MRTILMLILLFVAGTCFAEDPLETLNSVEDTLSTMEHTLNTQPDRGGSRAVTDFTDELSFEQELYFISEEPLGAPGWVRVKPCNPEGANADAYPASASCASPSDDTPPRFSRLWKSRAALPADLRPGVVVIAYEKERETGWFLAKVTDVSALGSGYVAVSAPFKARLKSLRVVEE
jgi:hypothetical protein